jgi:cell division septation protein DedD
MAGRTVHDTHQREVGMTRTDVMASSRPHAVRVARRRRGPSGALSRVLALPVLLLAITLAAPSVAVAATGTTPTTSGYNQEPNKPSTGTSPAKEESKPTTTSKAKAPETTSTPAPQAQKASTLPFTGLDLRWIVGIGVLMMGAGFSIVVMQRRQGRNGGR